MITLVSVANPRPDSRGHRYALSYMHRRTRGTPWTLTIDEYDTLRIPSATKRRLTYGHQQEPPIDSGRLSRLAHPFCAFAGLAGVDEALVRRFAAALTDAMCLAVHQGFGLIAGFAPGQR